MIEVNQIGIYFDYQSFSYKRAGKIEKEILEVLKRNGIRKPEFYFSE